MHLSIHQLRLSPKSAQTSIQLLTYCVKAKDRPDVWGKGFSGLGQGAHRSGARAQRPDVRAGAQMSGARCKRLPSVRCPLTLTARDKESFRETVK